jgi:hypothetical protein
MPLPQADRAGIQAHRKIVSIVKSRIIQHIVNNKDSDPLFQDKLNKYKAIKAAQMKTIAHIAILNCSKGKPIADLLKLCDGEDCIIGIDESVILEFIQHPYWISHSKYSRERTTDSQSQSRSSSKKQKSKIDSSLFLKSLNDGSGYGDSDDGYDSNDPELAKILNAKKNRPGQRMRRQLAEKKFGKDANHIQKNDRKGKRPTMNNDRRDGVQLSKSLETSARNLPPFKKSDAQAEDSVEDLHPSWAAKRKLNVNQSFQGKKIKF